MIKYHRIALSKRHFLKESVILRFVEKPSSIYIYIYIFVYIKEYIYNR